MDGERLELLASIDRHEAVLRRAITRAGPDPLFDSGLTMQQLRILLLLDTDGPLPQGDLAHALGVALPTVTGIVDRLVGRELVHRIENAGDRRIRLAGLTPDGVTLVEQIAAAGQKRRRRLLMLIDIDALRGLERGLAALRELAQDDSPRRRSQP